MKKQKPIKLNAGIVKRVQKYNYQVDRHGTCLICGKCWDDCSHNMAQATDIVNAVKMAEMLGIDVP